MQTLREDEASMMLLITSENHFQQQLAMQSVSLSIHGPKLAELSLLFVQECKSN